MNVLKWAIYRPHSDNVEDVTTDLIMEYRGLTQSLKKNDLQFLKVLTQSRLPPSAVLAELSKDLTRIIQRDEFAEFAGKLQLFVENVIQKGRMGVCAHVSSVEQ
jgi:hypothetical protein